MARTAMAVVREKQIRALELVRARSSYDEISHDLGYASRSSAWRLVNNGLKTAVAEVGEDYLQMELARLDALQAAHWQAALDCDLGAALLVLRVINTGFGCWAWTRWPHRRGRRVRSPAPRFTQPETQPTSGRTPPDDHKAQ